MLRTLTGLLFSISVLFFPPLSNGVTAARLAFRGKVFVIILLFIAFVKCSIKYGLANFVNLAGILSSPVETSVFKSLNTEIKSLSRVYSIF